MKLNQHLLAACVSGVLLSTISTLAARAQNYPPPIEPNLTLPPLPIEQVPGSSTPLPPPPGATQDPADPAHAENPSSGDTYSWNADQNRWVNSKTGDPGATAKPFEDDTRAKLAAIMDDINVAVQTCNRRLFDASIRSLLLLEQETIKKVQDFAHGHSIGWSHIGFWVPGGRINSLSENDQAAFDHLRLDLQIVREVLANEKSRTLSNCPQNETTPSTPPSPPPEHPTPPAEPPAGEHVWSGPYIGGELIGGWGHVTTTEFLDATDEKTNQFDDNGGGVGGAFDIGDIWTLEAGPPGDDHDILTNMGALMIGLDLDVDFNDEDWSTHTFPGGDDFRSRVDTAADIDGAIGIDVGDRLRFYGMGGLSVGDLEAQIDFGGPKTDAHRTVTGGNAGAGIEWRPPGAPLIGRSTSLFFEYRHTWWGAASLFRPAASPLFDYTFQHQSDRIGGGVRVRF